jgi:hypothetical protein
MASPLLLAIAIFLLVEPAVGPAPVLGSPFNGAASIATTSPFPGVNGTCLSSATAAAVRVPSSTRVALVQPVFTSTPYSQYKYGSFYAFFSKYLHTPGNITSDLGLLNTSLTSAMKYYQGWGQSYSLFQFISSRAAADCGLVVGRNVRVVTDVNVSDGALFGFGGVRAYDVVIVGFSEYVTAQEYSQLERFVASGGRLAVISSDDFEVKVAYSQRTGSEAFVLGHGYAFNGKTAWHSVDNAWEAQDTNWFGSSKCCFYSIQYHGAQVNGSTQLGSRLRTAFGDTLFAGYSSHEENAVRNLTDTKVVATFGIQGSSVVAAYIHGYGLGTVVCLCVFGTDIIGSDPSAQYFLVLAAALEDPGGVLNRQPSPQPPGLPEAVLAAMTLSAAGGIVALYVVRRRLRSRDL